MKCGYAIASLLGGVLAACALCSCGGGGSGEDSRTETGDNSPGYLLQGNQRFGTLQIDGALFSLDALNQGGGGGFTRIVFSSDGGTTDENGGVVSGRATLQFTDGEPPEQVPDGSISWNDIEVTWMQNPPFARNMIQYITVVGTAPEGEFVIADSSRRNSSSIALFVSSVVRNEATGMVTYSGTVKQGCFLIGPITFDSGETLEARVELSGLPFSYTVNAL